MKEFYALHHEGTQVAPPRDTPEAARSDAFNMNLATEHKGASSLAKGVTIEKLPAALNPLKP